MSIKNINLVQRLILEDIQGMRQALAGPSGKVDLLRVHPDVRIDLEHRNLVEYGPDGAGALAILVQGIRLEIDSSLKNQRGQYVIQLQAADILEIILVEEAFEPNPNDFVLQVLAANAATGFRATQVVVHPGLLEFLKSRGLAERGTDGNGVPIGETIRGLPLACDRAFELGGSEYLVQVGNGHILARFNWSLPTFDAAKRMEPRLAHLERLNDGETKTS
jgi:hypothetical protein